MNEFMSPAAVLRLIGPLLTIRYPNHTTLRRMEAKDEDFPKVIAAGGKRSYRRTDVENYVARTWGEEYVPSPTERQRPERTKRKRPDGAKRPAKSKRRVTRL